MATAKEFILGEAQRTLDDRYRLSIPAEMIEQLMADPSQGVLAKELSGCLSLWDAATWQEKFDEGVELVRRKMMLGKLEGRNEELQRLGRLLSTRHQAVPLAARSRLLIPEGFREFLGVEPGGQVAIVGAAVCIEIWNPSRWVQYIDERMPEFRQLFDTLSS